MFDTYDPFFNQSQSDIDIKKFLGATPPDILAGAAGALIAPLIVQKILGDSPTIQAFSVPIGWNIAKRIAENVTFNKDLVQNDKTVS